MELECPVPLNVGVSFAPTPSTPPRLGGTTDKWLIQPAHAGNSTLLGSWRPFPKAIVFCGKAEDQNQRHCLGHSLIKARWTLPATTDYPEGQLS